MATSVLDATNEVLAAVYTALNVAGITTTLGCTVWEHVPQGTAFPYIRISDVTARGETLETMGKSADDILVQVSVFPQHEGVDGARTIRKTVMDLLHNQSLTVSGATFVSCRAELRQNGADEEIDGVSVSHK